MFCSKKYYFREEITVCAEKISVKEISICAGNHTWRETWRELLRLVGKFLTLLDREV